MLSLFDQPTRLCDGLNRREWLRVGGLSALGLTMPQLMGSTLATESSGTVAPSPTRRAKACIVLFLLGGPQQHETWDPKPDAPAEIRGDFKPIASATPGLQVGELMPLTAKLTNQIGMDATDLARVFCWQGGWSSPVCHSTRSIGHDGRTMKRSHRLGIRTPRTASV
ncbi:MAG: DUF1501 domain-containing protein [Pirellulaceae bacterium]|nr:DUF1501 domain-containing protein [Pirellulaceae bacterium]